MSELTPGRLLVVDDEVELMHALRDTLAAQGFAVGRVFNSKMAVVTFGGFTNVLIGQGATAGIRTSSCSGRCSRAPAAPGHLSAHLTLRRH